MLLLLLLLLLWGLLLGHRLLHVVLGWLLSVHGRLPNLRQELMQLVRRGLLLLLLMLLLQVMLPGVEGRLVGARLQQWLGHLALLLLGEQLLRQMRLLLQPQAVLRLGSIGVRQTVSRLRVQRIHQLAALLQALHKEVVLDTCSTLNETL